MPAVNLSRNGFLPQLFTYFALFALGAFLASAQVQLPSIPAAPPPGMDAPIATAIGYVFWIFAPLGVIFLLIGLVSVMKHPGTGIIELLTAVVCLIVAAYAAPIVRAVYHPQS